MKNNRKYYVVVALFLSIFIEIFVMNYQYISMKYIKVLEQKELSLNDFYLKDFNKINDNTIISTSNDPSIIYENVNSQIDSIKFDITNEDDTITYQVFYTDDTNQNFSEEKSQKATFVKLEPKTYTLKFNNLIKIDKLRLDLTDQQDKKITINKIVLNPLPKFGFNFIRFLMSFFLICLIIYYKKIYTKYNTQIDKFSNNIIKYRYIIAGILFVILVIGKFHGSSIGVWDSIFKDKIDNTQSSTLIGNSRTIRSDEWAVQTPLILSQTMADEFYPYMNKNIRSNGMDMITSYYNPVLDISLIGKPFNWGFMILGKEYGFSWYWCLKIILLFMFSFEISMILTKRHKTISLFGAIMISLSPLIQWWYAHPFVDLIIYSQIIVVCIYYYIHSNNYVRKIVNIFGITVATIGFILSFYPPIQVPLAYLTLIFIIHIFFNNWKNINFYKYDYVLIFIYIAVVVGVMVNFLINSTESLMLTMNTVYPGKRSVSGGNLNITDLFYYLTNWLLPYKDNGYLNNCETSTFITLFPLNLIIYPIVYRKIKQNKTLLTALFIFVLVQLSWMFIPMPGFVGKITLFSFVTEARLVWVFGLTSLYLFIGILPQILNKELVSIKKNYFILFIILCSYIYISRNSFIINYLGNKKFIFTIILFIMLIYLFLKGKTTSFCLALCTVTIISGISVNPISRGLGSIYNKSLSKAIIDINQKESGEWAFTNSLFSSNYLIMQGVKTFNSVNFYPDFEKWSRLDESGIYKDIYNRYAHIEVILTSEETKFELMNPDYFIIYLNIDDLYKTDIKYIVSPSKLNYPEKLEPLYYNSIDYTYIYKLL